MNRKVKAALVSIASNTSLVISKFIIGLITGSVSIVSEAIHSGIDLVASIIAFFAVRISSKPADENHKYGHGKFENISGTVEALLIFIAAIAILIEAIRKIFNHNQIDNFLLGMAVMLFSAILNYFVSSYLYKVAKEEDSIALEADALHLRTDVYTSFGVFLGLILIYFTQIYVLDSIVAIIVALMIMREAFDITKRAFLPLVDTRLSSSEEEALLNIINKHKEDFLEIHSFRTRKSGSEIHIDFHLVMQSEKSLGDVHDLCNLIEHDLQEYNENISCLIHPEPKECKENI